MRHARRGEAARTLPAALELCSEQKVSKKMDGLPWGHGAPALVKRHWSGGRWYPAGPSHRKSAAVHVLMMLRTRRHSILGRIARHTKVPHWLPRAVVSRG